MKTAGVLFLLGATATFSAAAETLAAGRLDESLLQHHSAVREVRVRLPLRDASAVEVEEALRKIAAGPLSAAAAADYLIVVELLARKAGASAMELAQKHVFGDIPARELREAFVRGLGERDAETAMAWVEAHASADWFDEEHIDLTRIIIRAETRHSAQKAMTRALAIADKDPSRGPTHPLSVIEELAYLGEFEQAHELTVKVPSLELRSPLQATLVSFAIEHRPALAIAWFRELPRDSERASVLFRMMESLSTKRLDKAVAFYRTLDSDERSIDLAETIVVNGNDFSPADVEPLVNDAAAGEERDRLLIAALTRLDTISPATVPWSWFGRFADVRVRDRVLLSLLVPRNRRDPGATGAVVEQLAFLSVEKRAHLQKILADSSASASDDDRLQ